MARGLEQFLLHGAHPASSQPLTVFIQNCVHTKEDAGRWRCLALCCPVDDGVIKCKDMKQWQEGFHKLDFGGSLEDCRAKPCQVSRLCQGHGQDILKFSVSRGLFPDSGCSKDAATFCACCRALTPLWHCSCCESGLIPSEVGNFARQNARH